MNKIPQEAVILRSMAITNEPDLGIEPLRPTHTSDP